VRELCARGFTQFFGDGARGCAAEPKACRDEIAEILAGLFERREQRRCQHAFAYDGTAQHQAAPEPRKADALESIAFRAVGRALIGLPAEGFIALGFELSIEGIGNYDRSATPLTVAIAVTAIGPWTVGTPVREKVPSLAVVAE
jgi:hypothetical protein